MARKHRNESFYSALKELRELFHSSGRFDDSNAKLDEIVKLLAIEVCDLFRGGTDSTSRLKRFVADFENGRLTSPVAELKSLFRATAQEPIFRNSDGHSIFGSEPQLAIHASDSQMAHKLAGLIVSSFGEISSDQSADSFDLLNEAFGHFVRDNFRSNVEDAQYMTPPEVVGYICRSPSQRLNVMQAITVVANLLYWTLHAASVRF